MLSIVKTTAVALVLTTLPITVALSWDNILEGDLEFHVREFAKIPNQQNGVPPALNNMTYADGRLFVVDSLGGKIYDITNGETSLWFDVATALDGILLQSDESNHGVRAVAFHPDFSENGKFYTAQMEVRPEDSQNHIYLSDPVNPVDEDSVVREWTQMRDGSISPSREVIRIGVPGPHDIKQIIFNQHAAPDSCLLYTSPSPRDRG